MELVLSLFPGIDLLGRGYEAEGFCVVRGPDIITGGDVRAFVSVQGKFDGVIGGPPCQGFSRAKRKPDVMEGHAMLAEFLRVVIEAQPSWFLMENVPCVPDVFCRGYRVQRVDVDAREAGSSQRRLRHFQFGSKAGEVVTVARHAVTGPGQAPALASDGKRGRGRRPFAEHCRLQGLPDGFDLPGWTVEAKYRAVGNGVPVELARAMARAVAGRRVWWSGKLCACGCGRELEGKQIEATAACRKRMERRRRAVTRPAAVSVQGELVA